MSGTFDEVRRELAADLEAATEAIISPVLEPKCAGDGLQQVKERIQKAFAVIHSGPAEYLQTNMAVAAQTKPLRPLAEVAKHYVRAASILHEDVVVMHPSKPRGTHILNVPNQSYEELVAEAIRSMRKEGE
jgi:hypothetical protein